MITEAAFAAIFRLGTGLGLGMVLGSFVTMLSYRLPRGLSILFPRSRCGSCGHVLGVPDLVPVFSWLCAKGRCRHCGASIGGRYILIELFVTMMVTLAVWHGGASLFTLGALFAIVAGTTGAVVVFERKKLFRKKLP